MRVSVVITTKNEERNIGRCLDSIRSQTYPASAIETIVVDNNSSDRTKEIAREYTTHVYNIGPERSAQRNFGIERAQGTYALYLDADMILSERVIERCVEVMERDPSLVGLYIPEIVLGDSFWCRVRRFERSFYDGTVIDCVRFIRKDAFVNVGGFDTALTGPEDWDFDKKLRQIGRVALVTEPIYHNETDFDLHRYLRKKRYYGRSFASYIAKWGGDDPDIRRQFGVIYRYARVFIGRGQWRRLAAHPVLTSGMYTLRALIGVWYLTRRRQHDHPPYL